MYCVACVVSVAKFKCNFIAFLRLELKLKINQLAGLNLNFAFSVGNNSLKHVLYSTL
jgi:hypothetical protein